MPEKNLFNYPPLSNNGDGIQMRLFVGIAQHSERISCMKLLIGYKQACTGTQPTTLLYSTQKLLPKMHKLH